MATTLEPKAPPAPPDAPPPDAEALQRAPGRVREDPEALIAEARRRQRRRRLAITLLASAAVSAGTALYLSFTGTGSRATSTGEPPSTLHAQTMQLHLRGFGTPLATEIDKGPCPQGRTLIQITASARAPGGSVTGCVLTIRKWDQPHYGVKRIVQTARETYQLPGGTIVTREKQTINFARDQHHTSAVFRGRILRGSGRYAHARGTISGGGHGVDGNADWLVSLHLR